MKLNRKGFSLVEMLAAVAILGILSGVSVMAVSKYIYQTQQDAYEIMQKTVYDAAVSYFQKNPSDSDNVVTTDELLTGNYIEKLIDPSDKGSTCFGTVKRSVTTDTGATLDLYSYTVILTCEKFDTEKMFTN